MRRHQRVRFLRAVQKLLPMALALTACSAVFAQTAQTSLVAATHTVVGESDQSAIEHDCPMANGPALTAQKYTVTLTDIGAKFTPPAPLSYVAMAVTEGTALAGTPSSVNAAGAPITLDATAGASYTIHVVGLPGSQWDSGPVEEDVTDASGNKVCSWIDTLSAPSTQPSTVGVLFDTFTMTAASGSYTVALTDLQFPAAVAIPNLLLIDTTSGQQVLTLSPTNLSQAATLNQGDSYQLIAFAQEASGAAGGLFSVSISGNGATAYGPKIVPVGAVTLLRTSASGSPQSSFSLGSGTATLSLNNLPFPTVPLQSVGAVVVDTATAQAFPQNTTPPPGVTGTGTQSFTPPSASDAYAVYAYGVPDSTTHSGSYSVVVQQGTAFPFSEAEAVSSSSTIQAFSFDTSIAAAGSYTLTLTDFKFPVQLTADALAAVQSGQLVTSINAASNVSAPYSQGQVTLLAFGEEGGSPASPGLMGIDLSPAGGGAPAFDATEGIGSGFSSTSFTAQSGQSVQANVADLGFPAALASLNLAVTSGTKLVGTIGSAGSSGSFPFTTTANTTYNVNVLATPATPANSQQEAAGTYAMSVDPPPTVTLTASGTSVTSGGTVTLTWSSQNATSCTASASPSNSAWTGSETTSGGPVTTAAITANTTFTLSCTGGGGTGSATVTVSVSTASSGGKSGGGGALDVATLLTLAALAALRRRVSGTR